MKLVTILERVGPGGLPQDFLLYVCRGKSPGCAKYQKRGRHCGDCILPDESETIESVVKRLERGDA